MLIDRLFVCLINRLISKEIVISINNIQLQVNFECIFLMYSFIVHEDGSFSVIGNNALYSIDFF